MPQAQGALSQVISMMEASFKTLPTSIKSKKCYFSTEGLKFTQSFAQSKIIRGSSRHPTQSSRDKTDVGGGISTELNANTFLFYAALASMESVMTGGTMGSALTTPSAVIDSTNQIMTVTSTAHGLVPGDSIEILALTAPTSLNGKVWPVFDAPSANIFKIRIPLGTTSTFTIGSGTLKKVTAAGTILTHTLKAGGALPSYAIEKGFSDILQYFKYLGCMLSKLSFGIPSSGPIDLVTEWMGGAEAYATSSFDSGTPVDNGKRVFDGLSIAAADVKEGGSAIATITNVKEIAIDNQLDGDTFVVGGQGARGSINPGVYSISGGIECMFMDTTLYAKAKNLTESSLDFMLKRGTGDGTDGNETIQIVTPELIFKPAAPVIDGPKGIKATYDFEGFYDNGADATALKIIIKNAILPGAMI